MELFNITIPSGTLFYRGFNDKNNLSGNWFTYDINDAAMYGKKIIEYSLKKDINVINIMNGFFHIDYINKLNLKYTGDNFNGIDDRKYNAMVSLGLPDIDFQIKLLNNNGIDIKLEEDFYSRIYFNKNRFSSYQSDKDLVLNIAEFYKHKCDGFTNPVKYVDKFSKGFLPRELFLFDNTLLEYQKEIYIHTGGGNKIIQQHNLPPGELEMRIKKMVERDIEEFRKMPMIKRDTNEENKGLTESIKNMVQKDTEEFRKMPMIKRDTGDIKYIKKSKTRKQSKN